MCGSFDVYSIASVAAVAGQPIFDGIDTVIVAVWMYMCSMSGKQITERMWMQCIDLRGLWEISQNALAPFEPNVIFLLFVVVIHFTFDLSGPLHKWSR